jgi:hypothetical protein
MTDGLCRRREAGRVYETLPAKRCDMHRCCLSKIVYWMIVPEAVEERVTAGIVTKGRTMV